MRPRKIAVAALVAALLLGLLAGELLAAGKDTLTVGYYTKYPTLNLYQTTDRSTLNLGYLMWDPLLDRDPQTGQLKPHLVESWKNLDPVTWEFKLRRDVKFHNGHPLTAEAVRFTLVERILDPAQKSPQAGNFKWIKQVEAVDELTFRVVTEKPYPLILERFNTLFPLDPVETKAKGDAWLAEHPMGTGPYKLVKYERDARLVLAANPAYWMKGVPRIKNLVIKVLPEHSTRLGELLSGGVDVAENINPDQAPVIAKSKGHKLMDVPVLRISFWQFDSLGRAGQSPVKDVRVRRAIWHAIDRQAIIKTVLMGYAELLNNPLHPQQLGFDPTIKGYDYNPEKARALLKEAGYPDGFTLDLWQYEDYHNHPNQAAMGYLAQVGIKVNLHDYRGNIGQLITLRHSGKVAGAGNFTWGSYNIFDADAILAAWFLTDDPKDYTGDAELSAWLTEARFSVDQAKRVELYKKAQAKIFDQAYWMPFHIVHLLHGVNKNLDFVMGRDEVARYQHAYWK